MVVAVIFPALNEEQAIFELVKKVPNAVGDAETEIYVIDGGSTDKTVEKAEEAGAKVIHQKYKGGKGVAMREALEEINAQVYTFIDADNTYKPQELGKLVNPILENQAYHVSGSRFKKRDSDAFQYTNYFGNKMISWFFRRLTSSNVEDFLTGYRALDSKLAEELELKSKGFEIETEIVFKTVKQGYNIKEEDINYSSRTGESKLDFKTDGAKLIAYALKYSVLN